MMYNEQQCLKDTFSACGIVHGNQNEINASFTLGSFYTNVTMVASSKLEKPLINKTDRIMVSSMK